MNMCFNRQLYMQKRKITVIFSLVFLSLWLISACGDLSGQMGMEETEAIVFPVETAVPTPQVSPTDVIHPNSLAGLSKRAYGDGDFNIEYTWERKEEFVRYKVNYISDGLTIHGFVNIPEGKGPFPMVIALHGYIPASEYETLDYSTRYADSIARKGYIVLHPNLRNFPPSDSVGWQRDSLTGYTIDVLNLLAHVRGMAGQPGIFENTDLSRMGIWGHSLGGGIALRVVGLVEEIKAAVLYAAVSQRYSNRNAGFEVFNYQDTEATFSVHHGMDDDVISIGSSEKLCLQLEDAGKAPECFFYEDQPHTFYRQGDGDALFIKRTIEFLDRYLKSD